MRRSDLPFGSEFSPSQIELPVVLEYAKRSPDWKSFERAVRDKYFAKHGGGSEYNKNKLANNTKLGMIAYGIIDREARLTPFGEELYAFRNNEEKLYPRLAREILLKLHGMSLVQCLKDMTAAGDQVNLTTLRQGLADRGVHYPPGGKHPSIMRLWLAKAGVVVGTTWRIDEAELGKVLGSDPGDFRALSRFNSEQRAFLKALVNTGVTTPQPANEIAKLAEATYGVKFPEKSLPKLVLHALASAGYITAKKTTGGRGAKPFLVAPTETLVAEVVQPLLEQLEKQTAEPKLIDLLRKPLSEILAEVESEDRFIAGLALEALAFKLMRILDMTYVATRLRARKGTGGAEVDLIFESARLIFSRWQVQCKNTDRVSLDDVAKEVGLTHLLKSNAIVVISTGDVGPEARRFANTIMTDSNLCIVLLDRGDLELVSKSPAQVVDAFNRDARHAMGLKKLKLV